MNRKLMSFGFFLMITAAMFLVLAMLFVAYRPVLGIPSLLLDLSVMYLGVYLIIKGKQEGDTIAARVCPFCHRSVLTRSLEFKECRCYLLVRKEREVDGSMCVDCAERFYSEFQWQSFLKGWWSLPGLFRTPMLLMFNRAYIVRAREMNVAKGN